MEASTVTGVAKALLAFYKTARTKELAGVSLVTFARTQSSANIPSNSFVQAVEALQFPIQMIPERSALDPAAIRSLRKIIDQHSPDIVETHAVKSHVLLRCQFSRTSKWVAFHHGYTNQDFKMRLYNRMNPWALRGADHVITVCQPFLEQLATSGVSRKKISVVPNSIDRSMETSRVTRLGSILSIGRLSAEKGHRYLIDALAYLRQKYAGIDATLGLVGDGPERTNLERQAFARGLADRVIFAGHQADTSPFYPGAEVFVLPSLTEGSPLVLLEAMLARTPIVATSVGGVPETVCNERSALLVPPQQPEALGDAIARLLMDKNLAAKLAANAYDIVTQRHTPEAYCNSLVSIYRNLVDLRPENA
jgi:glycosyltransferase involved in cell wall biosynthesis